MRTVEWRASRHGCGIGGRSLDLAGIQPYGGCAKSVAWQGRAVDGKHEMENCYMLEGRLDSLPMNHAQSPRRRISSLSIIRTMHV